MLNISEYIICGLAIHKPANITSRITTRRKAGGLLNQGPNINNNELCVMQLQANT